MGAIDTTVSVLEGRLEFRIGGDAHDTGVFLVQGETTFEVLALTAAARAPLGVLERHRHGMVVKVVGTVRPGVLGAFIEATAIEIIGEAARFATANLGHALLELYQTTRREQPSDNPPNRVGNMYFHPEREGVVLEQVYIPSTGHGVAAALLDPTSGDVWFRTIDLASSAFADTLRGPYNLSKRRPSRGRPEG